ncbi:MAG TPA: two-component sensor histidine kinase, partial [Gammaproteobacteria bacterium]|nr:two-component sensor histidine kinase [Gammaproteobacteria bacterium]
MQLPRLFRTRVFRLTLAYMALFALSVGALSAFIYWATIGYLETQTNAIIEAEINGLYEQYERSSVRGLADVIDERVRRDTEGRSFYMLANPIGQYIAGNVTSWPRGIDDAQAQWADFVQPDSTTPVRAMLLRVGSFRLLVGRDIREQVAIR